MKYGVSQYACINLTNKIYYISRKILLPKLLIQTKNAFHCPISIFERKLLRWTIRNLTEESRIVIFRTPSVSRLVQFALIAFIQSDRRIK